MATSKISSDTFVPHDNYTGDSYFLKGNGVYRNVDGNILNTPNPNGMLIQFCPYADIDLKTRAQLYVTFQGDVYTRINWSSSADNWSSWKQIS